MPSSQCDVLRAEEEYRKRMVFYEEEHGTLVWTWMMCVMGAVWIGLIPVRRFLTQEATTPRWVVGVDDRVCVASWGI